MTRTEKRNPKRFPKVSRKFLGEGKKELNAYLKGKTYYRFGFIDIEGVKYPDYVKVKSQRQII